VTGSVFSVEDRTRLREELISRARGDVAISGAALVGSVATGREDRWSDIDLVLQLASDAVEPDVVAAWTHALEEDHDVVDHLDVLAGNGVRYRVFLLASTLQLDVSFWPHEEFRATEPGFQVVFGRPAAPTQPREPDPRALVGMAWLHALHARAAIARGRTWQAVMMLDGLRDQVVALACCHRGLNPHHGRDADALPAEFTAALAECRASSPEEGALRASLAGLSAILVQEAGLTGHPRTASLQTTLSLMAAAE
jgi:predicted nucleotidyltransferase